ncbi:hypothetical protein ATO49_25720 [Mycolicibacterium fortuitum subsp. fortuitum DSM 46621 = ATCC 6841 = JCM 6387]|nr:hypothetical protein ATO49_25720 [Mycolicibacterium fortuitum subsp. fortuitum DSM 46621 = ATCC 6841 = JCM 6387]
MTTVIAAPAGRAESNVMDSFPPEHRYWAGRRPLTETRDTVRASDRSRVKLRTAAKVTAVMVAVPASRLIATLYSRSSS